MPDLIIHHLAQHFSNTLTGAFVAAPLGGLLWALGTAALRIASLWLWSRIRGHRFDALDRPVPRQMSDRPGAFDADDRETESVLESSVHAGKSGRFF